MAETTSIVQTSVQVAPRESVTATVKLVVPGVAGVPEINPEASSVKPGGKAEVVENARGPVPKVLPSI
jgi:hypothetical protein